MTTACHRWALLSQDAAHARVEAANEAFFAARATGSPARSEFERWGREIDGFEAILNLSFNQYSPACVWWSIAKAAWGCQIGEESSWHYSEQAAIDYAKERGMAIARRSLIAA